ncbi:NAD(P)/FAD-dependent oxidoreductase [Kibdelosporangium persicum]|nr:FAD-dependent oxidoreductase [Kibdelosporangium persicum]
MTKHSVVVLGAGYGGLMAALRAADQAEVTLIAPSSRFTERVREHELAAGRPDITHPLSTFIRNKPVTHVAARATTIDPVRREVRTDDGGTYSYDRLVYALGSRTKGYRGCGRVFTSENASYLRKRLDDGPGTLTVVGGSLTGIEMASELASAARDWRVRMVTAGELGPSLSAKGRAHVRSVFAELGIAVREGQTVTPEEIDSDVVLWAASMTPNTELAAEAGIALDSDGRVAVDATLRSVSYPDIYAVGDAAGARTETAGPLRMACAAALPVGSRAGKNIALELRGREPRPLSFRYYAQCVSLGRDNGLFQFVNADDSPKDTIVTGRLGALIKERVVRWTVFALRHA